MTDEKLTAYQWRKRAEKAELRYQKLKDEIAMIRARDFADAIELCDHRAATAQVRQLLVDAMDMIDDIRESEAEAERLYQLEMGKS